MNNILLINACVRPESRTRNLADYLLSKIQGEVTIIDLYKEDIPPMDNEKIEVRNRALETGDMNHPILQYAGQFAKADIIVIAAPYWDLSFPAWLKIYIESICAVGVTFAYDEQGRPYGLCKASKLYYLTTAGGPIISDELGFGYIRTLCETFYGIKELFYVKAENLDMWGIDVEQILQKAKADIDALFAK